ncbi:MAG: leucine-rich repeat domain-containing protein [Blautia sp.]|nr:leucine-rich repeat domain-containing protein [Blautia sp.]
MKRKRWERVLAALLTIILFCSSTGAEDLFTSDSNVNDLYAGFQDESNQDDSFEEVDLADEADLTRAAEGLNQESAEENELSQEDFFSSVSDLPEGMEQPGSEYDGDMSELTGGYEEEAGPEVQESIYSEEEILFTDGMNETEEDPLAVVSAESDFEIDEDGNLISYTGAAEIVTIPESVTSIAYGAFQNCETMKKVIIQNDLDAIGEYAFYGCTNLEEVVFPENVRGLGLYAFEYCTSLKEISFGNGLPEIPDSAFYGCQSLTSVTMPDTVTRIGTYAFYECGSLTEIHFSKELTQIDRNAFDYCDSLTELHLPGGVSDIYLYYSYNDRIYCSTYDCVTARVVSRSGSGFFVEGEPRYLFRYVTEEPEEGGESEEKLALARYLGEEENVTVPGYIEHLYDHAFQYTNVVEVTIPDGVTMGNTVFDHCESLERVNLPSDLTTIPIHTFNSCRKLTEISLPSGVAEIGYYAFSGCESLREIVLPCISEIPDSAFYGCQNLTTVTMPDTVTRIGTNAFYDCGSLTEIHFSSELTQIDRNAFYGCGNLTELHLPGGISEIDLNYSFWLFCFMGG